MSYVHQCFLANTCRPDWLAAGVYVRFELEDELFYSVKTSFHQGERGPGMVKVPPEKLCRNIVVYF